MPPPVDPATELTARIREQARALGFEGVGILPAGPSRTHAFYEAWLARGYAGEMAYLHRHAGPKRDPARLLPGARSLIVLTHSYHVPFPGRPPEADGPRGRVSRYAWGQDYHEVLLDKLHRLAAFIEAEQGRPLRYKAFVDSGPVMEREFAARAGLGWVGRNAMLIDWRLGSWLFLAELLLDVPLAPDEPPSAGREGATLGLSLRESCGSCTACLTACPTGAIVADKTVDSRRCISYLTIELKGPVPEPLRPALGEWVFGCDLCQEVCPWNRRAPHTAEPAFRPQDEGAFPSLPALLALDEAGFRARFRHTSLWRSRRRRLLRNAAIVLANRVERLRAEDPPRADTLAHEALSALEAALDDAEPLVRGAAAWALGRLAGRRAAAALRRALAGEADPGVRAELGPALARLDASTRSDGPARQ